MEPVVIAVARSPAHGFSKATAPEIRLLAGLGVEGDAHAGNRVKHRSRVARDPTQPNLRQVHLLPAELLEELRGRGFRLQPGDVGENLLTGGIDLMGLPTGTRLHLGETATVEVTGLRNLCAQLDRFQAGLTAAMLDRAPDGSLLRRAGIMGIVQADGVVRPGDVIRLTLPRQPYRSLQPV
jgi:MOSC domain-containing protein YiiM